MKKLFPFFLFLLLCSSARAQDFAPSVRSQTGAPTVCPLHKVIVDKSTGHVYVNKLGACSDVGTTAVPGGSSGQVEYNSSGAFAGNNGLTYDGANLGVGLAGTSPPTKFTVGDTSSSTPRGLMSWQASNDTNSAHLHMRKSRGTFASPAAVLAGDILGRLVYGGYDGSSYLEMGSIRVTATGTVASTRIPTKMEFMTGTDAAPSVLTTALTLDKDQSATFAGGVKIGAGSFITSSGAGGALGSNAFNSAAIPATNSTTNRLARLTSANTYGDSLLSDDGTNVTQQSGQFLAPSLKANGTAGAGYFEGANQSGAPGTPTGAGRLFWDSSNRLSWIGTNGFTRTFDGTANTANRVYTLPDADSKIPVFSQTITFIGPTAGRTVTLPDANFTAARTDAANTFTGNQTFSSVTLSRVVGSGTAPTIAVTGFGTSPTASLGVGSTDHLGVASIQTGTTPSSSGTITITFTTGSGGYGTNGVVCTATFANATGTWNARATVIIGSQSTAQVVFNWDNNAVNLTAAQAYNLHYICGGR